MPSQTKFQVPCAITADVVQALKEAKADGFPVTFVRQERGEDTSLDVVTIRTVITEPQDAYLMVVEALALTFWWPEPDEFRSNFSTVNFSIVPIRVEG